MVRRAAVVLTGIALALAMPLALVRPQDRPAQLQSADPPGRVGRVSAVTGDVSLHAFDADSDDWTAASINYPLTTGDALWAGADARAEAEIGSATVWLAASTSAVFDAIDDSTTQVRLTQGTLEISVRAINPGEVYQVDVPQGSVSLWSPGRYRFDVTPDGRRSTVTVRDGHAQAIALAGATFEFGVDSAVTLTGLNDRPFAFGASIAEDDWEQWSDSRDSRGNGSVSATYVSRDMVGYGDLDEAGDWQVDGTYGAVWYPHALVAQWAPYRFGRWMSVAPWGWTWVDDAAWGFAPYHYGRWVYLRGRWGWVAGDVVTRRPIYAPALVAFISSDNWGVTVPFGAGDGIGWVPLAPGEPFIPAYPASPAYLRGINGSVTRRDVTRTNMAQQAYANRAVPGAVTVVARDQFVQSQPVGAVAVVPRPEQLIVTRAAPTPMSGGRPVTVVPSESRPRPGTVPPAGHPPVVPPPVARPPVRVRPAPPPAPVPPAVRPAVRPASPPGQSVQAAAPVNPPATVPLSMADWQRQRQQIVTRQQQEQQLLLRRHQQELRAPPPNETADQTQQRQLRERSALAVRQKQELDAFDKRKPGH